LSRSAISTLWYGWFQVLRLWGTQLTRSGHRNFPEKQTHANDDSLNLRHSVVRFLDLRQDACGREDFLAVGLVGWGSCVSETQESLRSGSGSLCEGCATSVSLWCIICRDLVTNETLYQRRVVLSSCYDSGACHSKRVCVQL
jgi:hypothetical protein